MTPTELLVSARRLAGMEAAGTVQLTRNQVGNLAIVFDGSYAGYLDLATGEIELTEDGPT